MEKKPHILSLSPESLTQLLVADGMPKFRAKQVWDWVMTKGVLTPDAMLNLSKTDREKLTSLIDFSLPTVSAEQRASDGVIKWLFKLHDGHEVETVLIPERERGTLCVSSQVGCTLNCRFCHTGTQALARNLTADEIVAQVYLAKCALDDWQKEGRKVTNIVFMGMGEPLYNTDNVITACHTLMHEEGMNFGNRRITLSTSGVVPQIARIGAELGTNLAISIHAPDDETRTRIMPINNKWNVAELLAAVKAYPLKAHRRITWEYVMLDGVNDSEAHAHALGKLIQDIPSLVNIIPFNPWPGSPFERSSNAQIERFAKVLDKYPTDVTVRRPRGEDILAACGQLRSESSKKNTVSLEFPSVVAQYGTDQQKERLKVQFTE